ncbi:ROK family transcriptional regulator [Streptomyces tagetis]|uniref:ROK family protein n=1 Tax=Streptomyces tagetis TaxID=2820809 RepID=A0A941B9K3_9ACTN|nr:ROK family transcriptional regulator [Streptomyces sp. RG38]MBQ0829648.1 ROK family protein [Streptomyces sp. RG38]
MAASPSTARALNDRLALRLLQQEGPLTAARLKQLTGLSRPTVADLVERLTVAGLIEVAGESREQRRGPNAKLYGIVADRAHLAALDVRTGSVAVLVSDLLGRVLAEASVPIGDDTRTGPAVERAVTLVERAVKEAGAERLHTVAIGAPGLIDPAVGELRDSSGLPAWHRQLVAALQERFPAARIGVENETNLAALAEQRDGAARDRDTFVLLWLGLGIGAGVVLDGTLRRGVSGGAGEIGFLPVPGVGGLPSSGDCHGGFHSLAGAAAVTALAAEHGVNAGPGEDAVSAGGPAGPGGSAGGLAGPGGSAGGLAGPGSGVSEPTWPGVSGGGPAGQGASGGGPGERRTAVGDPAGPGVSTGAPARHGTRVSDPTWPGTRGGDPARPGVSTGPREAPAPLSPEGVVEPEPRAAVLVRAAVRDLGADPAAGRFLDDLAHRIALGAAAVVSVLDPGCLVLAGEIGRAGGEALAVRVQDRLDRMSPLATEVRPTALGGGAVLRGALLTARDRAQDELFAP